MKRFLSIILVVALTMGIISSLGMNAYAKDENFVEVTPFEISNAGDFQEKLVANANKVGGGVITGTKSGEVTHYYFKFTMPKSGIASIQYNMAEDENNSALDAKINTYANKEMSIIAAPFVDFDRTTSKINRVYLPAGTYYVAFKGNIWKKGFDSTNTVGLAVGYIPAEKYSEGFSYSLSSTTKTADDVVIKINTADPDAEIYVANGAIKTDLVGNGVTWNGSKKIEGNEYTVSKNDTYTIRIKDSLGKCNQKIIRISNIDKSRPSSPVATDYKSGSKQIVGKAQSGMLVTANVAGKSYSAVVRDNGIFTISTPALVKNAKITLQAQSATGLKSDVKTFTVQ